MPCALCLSISARAADSNIPGTIGPFGVWTTPENGSALIGNMRNDAESFQAPFQKNVVDENGKLKEDFVPVEAKVGRTLIGALSMVGNVLDRSLGGFISILLVILFAFWIMMETYQTMKEGQDVKKLGLEIAKKGMWITIWFIILALGPARLFMWIMSPIITAGTHMSDLILNAVTGVANVKLPDTCTAIHNYINAHPVDATIISPEHAADLLCVPTRLSGFFYTCVSAGFKWMAAGLGHSALTFFAGLVFVVMFIYNIWKFALQALGVVSSMFFAVLMLPFTAVSECFAKGTSLKDAGLFTKFFGMLAGMFGGVKVDKQIMTFINATIYFVVLSVVAAIGLAILGTVAGTDFSASMPTVQGDDFMMVLICGALVAYLANQAGEITKDLGGAIENEFGKQVEGDIGAAWKNTTKGIGNWWKALRKK